MDLRDFKDKMSKTYYKAVSEDKTRERPGDSQACDLGEG